MRPDVSRRVGWWKEPASGRRSHRPGARKRFSSPGEGWSEPEAVVRVTREREVALSVLRQVSRGRRLDRALEAAGGLEGKERHWVQQVTYGVARYRARLDYLLDLHLSKGLKSLSPHLLDVFRLGAYQLLYLGGVPDYAALSQTVEQVRGLGGEAMARLANAVLRSLAREGGGEERFPAWESDPLRHLATWGSHPSWLLARWAARWPWEEVRGLVNWNNTPPPLYLRPLDLDPAVAALRLAEAGWPARPVEGGVPCVLLEGNPEPLGPLGVVRGIIQDPGAALVVAYANPPPGVWIADLCAAPGGKALALARGGRRVLAADLSFSRLRLVRENLRRVGGEVWVVQADARHPPLAEALFVLLDVPCTGTGTFRRHPDARWRMTPALLQRLTELQTAMLLAVSRLVPRGGYLVYATCSLEVEENEDRVKAFLQARPEFCLAPSGAVGDVFLDSMGCLRVLPQRAGFDGAFAARMVRRGRGGAAC